MTRQFLGVAGTFSLALLSAGLVHCGEAKRIGPAVQASSATSQAPTKATSTVAMPSSKAPTLGAPTDSAGIRWPAFQVIAQGFLLHSERVDTAFLELESRAEGLRGSFRKSGDSAYTLRNIHSSLLLDTSTAGSMRTARYRLTYTVDRCQHSRPAPADASFRWGHCFHYEGKPKPAHLVRGEAEVSVQIVDKMTLVTAVGFLTSGSLDEVFRVKGAMLP